MCNNSFPINNNSPLSFTSSIFTTLSFVHPLILTPLFRVFVTPVKVKKRRDNKGQRWNVGKFRSVNNLKIVIFSTSDQKAFSFNFDISLIFVQLGLENPDRVVSDIIGAGSSY